MNTQDELFHSKQTWMHYIGGYYKTTDIFLREAKSKGITRRIPPQVARGMQYGDKVILLRYAGDGKVFAFAEMTINNLVLDGDISKQIGEQLRAQGKASYSDCGGEVERECGSFIVMGTWTIDAEMSEIVDMACKIAEKEQRDTFMMIGGVLTKVYESPVMLFPAPKFTRSFIRANEQVSFELCDTQEQELQIVSIEGYQKKEKKSRKSAPMLAL